MNQLIPFAPKAVARKSTGGMAAALLANMPASGFPYVSIKGKVFHVVRGDERTLVTKPGEDDPAAALEVVIVGANPNRSRVFYKTGYEEGSNAKPDCYSNDGKAPATDAQAPQAKTCAACVHGQFGSKVDANGKKGFACSNSYRIAVAPIGQLNDPMLVRIPGGTIKTFTEYVKEVSRAGYDLDEVATKIGFDYSVAHPALTFKAVGVLPDDMVASAKETGKTELVGQIIGTVEMPHAEDEEPFESPVAALPKREPKPVKAVKADDELDEVHAKAAAKPKPKVKVEDDAAPAPQKAAVATIEEMGEDLDALLNGTDFDD